MPSTNMSDIVTAKALASHAVNNPEVRHEYFDFLKSLREKNGPEYSTMVHQYASKLLHKDVHPVVEAKGLGKHVSIVKGHYAGQTGYVRQIKTDRIRNKVYLDIDLEDGGQTVEPKENCRVIKNVDETIVKTGSEYELKSSKGKNLGKFPSKAKAEKHEQEVNYFKHMDEDGEKRFAVGDNVLVKNYQGVGKIHSILHRGAVRVILPNNVRAEVDMGDLRQATNKFEPTVQFEGDETNPVDAITVDIPLMIRLMEYAKEDAADDMALHQVAEKLTALSQEGRTLTMTDYDAIVNVNTQGI